MMTVTSELTHPTVKLAPALPCLVAEDAAIIMRVKCIEVTAYNRNIA